VTGILGILGIAALFVAFGLMQRCAAARSGCGACEHEPAGPNCSTCELAPDESESNHAAS
jgi:hypothetical protein